MLLTAPVLVTLLQATMPCLESPVAGDLLGGRNQGGSFGRRAAISILDLVEHENEARRSWVAVAYFFPETMFHSGHRGGAFLVKDPSTGCVEPWMHRFSDVWNLDDQPRASDPDTWTSALRFEALLDGRRRTFEIGGTVYELAAANVFAVFFDDELRPEVHRTDESLTDLPVASAARAFVIERLRRRGDRSFPP